VVRRTRGAASARDAAHDLDDQHALADRLEVERRPAPALLGEAARQHHRELGHRQLGERTPAGLDRGGLEIDGEPAPELHPPLGAEQLPGLRRELVAGCAQRREERPRHLDDATLDRIAAHAPGAFVRRELALRHRNQTRPAIGARRPIARRLMSK
jgi:hypothetical protein